MTSKNTVSELPWYRHRWPWILMAGPATVVVAGIVTVYLAVRSSDGLVEDDYYKQGLAVNQLAERDQKAVALGLQADLMQSTDGTRLRVALRADSGSPAPAEIQFRALHPTRPGGDQQLTLRAEQAGQYAGVLTAPLQGRWRIVLEDGGKEWRLTGVWMAEKGGVVHLPMSASGG